MHNIERAVSIYTGFDKIKVMKNVLFTVDDSSASVELKDGRKNTILGLLAGGTVNCNAGDLCPAEPEVTEEEENAQPQQGGAAASVSTSRMNELTQRQLELKEAEEKARQEEAERKAREEEERRINEEKARKREEKRRRKEEWKKNNVFTRCVQKMKNIANSLVNEDE